MIVRLLHSECLPIYQKKCDFTEIFLACRTSSSTPGVDISSSQMPLGILKFAWLRPNVVVIANIFFWKRLLLMPAMLHGVKIQIDHQPTSWYHQPLPSRTEGYCLWWMTSWFDRRFKNMCNLILTWGGSSLALCWSTFFLWQLKVIFEAHHCSFCSTLTAAAVNEINPCRRNYCLLSCYASYREYDSRHNHWWIVEKYFMLEYAKFLVALLQQDDWSEVQIHLTSNRTQQSAKCILLMLFKIKFWYKQNFTWN